MVDLIKPLGRAGSNTSITMLLGCRTAPYLAVQTQRSYPRPLYLIEPELLGVADALIVIFFRKLSPVKFFKSQ